ncbi:MAG: ATP-dependent helicase [Cetobacterium sp.]
MNKNNLKYESLKIFNFSNSFKNILISNLNFEQLIAVKNLNGNFLILAGAGSGKTRVIIYRTFLLLKLQSPADKILILTFTRKAINEIKERIQNLTPSNNLHIETFHSFAYKILKKYTHNKKIEIITSDSAIKLAHDSKFYENIKLKVSKEELIKSITSSKENYLKSISFKNLDINIKKLFLNFLNDIEEIKKIKSLYSFDDLLNNLLYFLKEDNCPISFNYIMVDEYQDTDNIQVEILKILSKKSNLMAVGDDYQSIYSFKGASIENILNFSSDFKNSKTFVLKENYRSSETILNLSNEFSKSLRYSFRKVLISNNSSDKLPCLNIFKNHFDEVNFIYCKIISILNKNENSTIAILFRNYSYMEEFIKLFDKYKLNYNITQNIFLENIFKDKILKKDSKLSLLTIHSSKGLEWDYVFVPLLLDGIIPTSLGNTINIEEEKRLFYVAITRAKKELFLSYPLSFYNNYGLFSNPSPFVNEINSEFFNIKRG